MANSYNKNRKPTYVSNAPTTPAASSAAAPKVNQTNPATPAPAATTPAAGGTQSILGSGGLSAITGAGGLSGIMTLTGQQQRTGTGRSTGSGSGSGTGYVATTGTAKKENPYDRTGTAGGGNPYAELLDGAGQGSGVRVPEALGERTGLYGVSQGTQDALRGAQGMRATIPEAEAERDGLYGVRAGTQAQLDRYGEYDPSQQVREYQERLRQIQGQAPGEYEDPYQQRLSELYEQISGRPGFQYDLNGDMLYRQYAQQYQQMGRQAMQDAMGQAAAMTGGYGSSYASTAGNQAYQGYLSQLNERIPELYDRALAAYQAEGDQLKDQYGMLRDMQDTDYGRYQDQLARYYQDLGLAREDYSQERAFDYGQFGDARDYWTRMAQLESQDARTSQDYEMQRAQMQTEADRDLRDYWTQQAQLESQDAWRGREDEFTRAQLQAQLDQDARDYQLGLIDRSTEWGQSEQARQYELLMTMLQMGIDPSDEVKAGSGLTDYDIWELQQKLKPSTGGVYVGGGSSSGRSGSSTGTGSTLPYSGTHQTVPKPTGQVGTQDFAKTLAQTVGRGLASTPEDKFLRGEISEQQLYELQERRARQAAR